MRCWLLLLWLCSVGLLGCFDHYYIPPEQRVNPGNQTSADWQNDYNDLLQKYVHPTDGLVDYQGLFQDRARLDGVLLALKTVDPQGWSGNQRLAFWINAYNIGMLTNIIKTMQTDGEDIFDTKKVIDFGDLFFKGRSFDIARLIVTLDDIENGILRRAEDLRSKFPDGIIVDRLRPEIHVAISCAALSCPPLRNTIWSADTVDQALRDALRKVVNNPRFLSLDTATGKPKMSQIFNWFFNDFQVEGKTTGAYIASLITDPALQQALQQAGNDKTKLTFVEYDWSLNQWRR